MMFSKFANKILVNIIKYNENINTYLFYLKYFKFQNDLT